MLGRQPKISFEIFYFCLLQFISHILMYFIWLLHCSNKDSQILFEERIEVMNQALRGK
jgi:hypothetical protein